MNEPIPIQFLAPYFSVPNIRLIARSIIPAIATGSLNFIHKSTSPKINVKTEKWDGGHTYISISFYDYDTNQSIAVVKSSGIGLTISQDQKLAYKAIKKELDKVFLKTE